MIAPPLASANGAEADPTNQSIVAVLDFHAHGDGKIAASQRLLERASLYLEHPACRAIGVGFVEDWITFDRLLRAWRVTHP